MPTIDTSMHPVISIGSLTSQFAAWSKMTLEIRIFEFKKRLMCAIYVNNIFFQRHQNLQSVKRNIIAALICAILYLGFSRSACSSESGLVFQVGSTTASTDVLRKLVSVARSIIGHGDLHDVGYIEKLFDVGFLSREIYGDYRDFKLYYHGLGLSLGPDQAPQAAGWQPKIIDEIWFEPPEKVLRQSGLKIRLVIYVMPRLAISRAFGNIPVKYWQAELTASYYSNGSCPTRDVAVALIGLPPEQSNGPPLYPVYKPGSSGGLPTLEVFDFGLVKKIRF